MRAIFTLAVAGALALSAASPTFAASKKRHVAPPSDATEQSAPVAWRGEQMAPVSTWRAPPGCVVDEGYGRFSSCDEGGY